MADFKAYFSESDASACRETIEQLKKESLDDWQSVFVEIDEAMRGCFNTDVFMAVLQSLPEEQLENAYRYLLRHIELPSECMNCFCHHALALNNERVQLFNRLAFEVISSQACLQQDMLCALLARIHSETLKGLLLEKKNNALDQEKYKALLKALCIQAQESPDKFHTMVLGHPALANETALQHLHLKQTPEEQRTILIFLLNNASYYDWQAPVFKKAILRLMLDILSTEQGEAAFKLYVNLHQDKSPSQKDWINLLDAYYEVTQDEAQFLKLIAAAKDKKPDFLVNYIGLSRLEDQQLKQALLKELPLDLMFSMMGHVFLLQKNALLNPHNQSIFDDFLRILCEKLLLEKNSAWNKKGLLQQIESYPELQGQFIDAISIYLNKSPQLLQSFLIALWDLKLDKTHVLSASARFIEQQASHQKLLNPLLGKIAAKKHPGENETYLTCLYDLLQQRQVADETYHGLIDFFSDGDRQSLLCHLLLEAATMPSFVAFKLIEKLDDRAFLNLISEVLLKVKQNPAFADRVYQSLLIFCQKLSKISDEQAHIHQWQNQAYSNQLAETILKMPEAVQILCGTWYMLYSIEHALRLRISRVLNQSLLDTEAYESIALGWFSYYKNDPTTLICIFNNLEQSKRNLDVIGEQNYSKIKMAFWSLALDPKEPYAEEAFLKRINALKMPAHLDESLRNIAFCCEQYPADTRAILLAQTGSAIPEALPEQDERSLIDMLLISGNEETAANWKKISQWLKVIPADRSLNFLSQLLDKGADNPLLRAKLHQVLIDYQPFDLLLKTLGTAACLWIVKNTAPDTLEERFAAWLEVLLSQPQQEFTDIAQMLLCLPKKPIKRIIDCLKGEKAEDIASVFHYLSVHAQDGFSLILYAQALEGQNAEWQKQFLQAFYQKNKADKVNELVIHILNNQLMEVLHTFEVHSSHDTSLINKHIQAIRDVIFQASDPKTQHELSKPIALLLSIAYESNADWFGFILQSQPFSEILKHWMDSLCDEKGFHWQEPHPISNFFIEKIQTDVEVILKTQAELRRFVVYVLQDLPITLNNDRFHLLFERLDEVEKIAVLKKIIEKHNRNPMHERVLPQLVSILDVTYLYEAFEKITNDFSLVRSIFYHQDSLSRLSEAQLNLLISKVEKSRHLKQILDAPIPLQQKTAFMHRVFAFCHYNPKQIAAQFSQWGIDQSTLILMSNYTLNEDKGLFQLILKEKKYYIHYLEAYLKEADREFQITKHSFLFDFIKEKFENPLKGHFIHPFWTHCLEPEDKILAFKSLLSLKKTGHQFSQTLQPFASCSEVMTEAFQAADWYMRLILFRKGILPALSIYKNASVEQQSRIEKSRLYLQVLSRFKNAESIPSHIKHGHSARQLETFLEEFLAIAESIDPEKTRTMTAALRSYRYRIDVFEQFCPDQSLSQAFRSGEIAKEQNKKNFTGAYEIFYKSEHAKVNQVDRQVQGFLNVCLHDESISRYRKFRELIIDFIFYSPFSVTLSQRLIQDFLHQIPVDEYKSLICNFYSLSSKRARDVQILKVLSNAEVEELGQFFTRLDDLKQRPRMLQLSKQLALKHTSDLINLVIACSQFGISKRQRESLLLEKGKGLKHAIDWVRSEREEIEGYEQFLKDRGKTLSVALLSYHTDANNQSRLQILQQIYPDALPKHLLIGLLTSYQSLFSASVDATLKQAFLNTFAHCLQKSIDPDTFLSHFPEAFIHSILMEAINQVSEHQSLLHRFIIDNKWSKQCLEALINQLSDLVHIKGISLELLSKEQAQAVSVDNREALFAIFRLLLIKDPWVQSHPILENKSPKGKGFQKQCYLMNLRMQQQLHCISKGFPADFVRAGQQWLMKTAVAMHDIYAPMMITYFCNVSVNDLQSNSQWLMWAFEVNQNQRDLIEGFLFLTGLLPAEYKQYPDSLQEVLQYIADRKLLTALCGKFLMKKNDSGFKTSNLLLQSIVGLKELPPESVDYVLSNASWSCLEQILLKNSNTERDLVLLTRFIEEPFFCVNEMVQDKAKQKCFLDLLHQKKFPVTDIVNWISHTASADLKSLMLIHLLSRADFFELLPGSSDISLLKKGALPERRIQHLLAAVDSAHLTEKVILMLQPETAFNFLCTARYFHCWDKARIHALSANLPMADLTTYFMANYSALPHAPAIVKFLFDWADTQVFAFFEKAVNDKPRQEIQAIFTNLLKHAEDIPQINADRFIKCCDETALCLAINYYRKANPSENLAKFINGLFTELVLRNEPLSETCLKHLLLIIGDSKFELLNKKTSYIICEYLRIAAFNEHIEVFYDDDFHFPSAQSTLIPADKFKAQNEKKVFEAALQGLWRREQQDIPESELFAEAHASQAVKLIDYFLCHYQGDETHLSRLLSSYFQQFNHREAAIQQLNSTIELMQAPEVSKLVKETIFSTLLKHQQLQTDQIIAQIISVDTALSLRVLADGKFYPEFIMICDQILNEVPLRISMNQADIVKQAKSEAAFELALLDISYFKSIRIWFRRCVFYGWEGFFSPKKAQYVKPAEYWAGRRNLEVIMSYNSQIPEEVLAFALDHHDKPLLAQALKACNAQKLNEEKLQTIRLAVDAWWCQQLADKTDMEWIYTHEALFQENQRYLLEYMLVNKPQDVLPYLNQMGDSNKALTTLKREYVHQSIDWPALQEILKVAQSQMKQTRNWPGLLFGAASSLGGVAYSLGSNTVGLSASALSYLNFFMPKTHAQASDLSAQDGSSTSPGHLMK